MFREFTYLTPTTYMTFRISSVKFEPIYIIDIMTDPLLTCNLSITHISSVSSCSIQFLSPTFEFIYFLPVSNNSKGY